MLSLAQLPEEIFKRIEEPSIILFSVGSEFSGNGCDADNRSEWKTEHNQQLPLFLHNFKLNNMDVKLKIVLIDPMITSPPYIVSNESLFLGNSWTVHKNYSNVFISEYGVEVYVFKNSIYWNPNHSYEGCIDITELVNLTSSVCSAEESNTLFFYSENTGTNPIFLEEHVKSCCKESFCPTKVCIDITRGSDFGCYVDYSNPINYPVIEFIRGKLSYKNIEYLSFEYKKMLYNKFIDQVENKIDNNNNELLLFHQIRKHNILVSESLKNSIISMIRQLYTINNRRIIGENATYMKNIKNVNNRLNLNSENIANIISYVKQLEEIKENPTHDEIREIIIEELKISLYMLLEEVILKLTSNVSKYDIESFIQSIKEIPDKYKIIDMYNTFCQIFFI